MKKLTREALYEALRHFGHPEMPVSAKRATQGHINDTILVDYPDDKLVVQRMNTDVFRDYKAVMHNIRIVTDHIREKVVARGENADRATLHFLPCDGKHLYYLDGEGSCFRCYHFIANSTAYDQADTAELFGKSAYAFGQFQKDLADFDAEQLNETIPHFHDTAKRYQDFLHSVESDSSFRGEKVSRLIEFVKARERYVHIFPDAHEKGLVPLRVTHNDTKLNNVLFDDATNLPLAVIDLDTVMPGYSCFDFGDSIRFGANPCPEDEKDLSKVHIDLDYFTAYVRGYLQGAAGGLLDSEVRFFTKGAMLMTYECGMRFLADYLDGDVYFKTNYSEQNRDRAACQFALLASMEEHEKEMDSIVERELAASK